MEPCKIHLSKLLLLSLSLFLLFPGVMAQNVSFADPDATTHRDVFIYYANGTLAGQYNTTSNGVTIPNATTDGDFMIVLKPQYSNPLDDPVTFADSLYSWLTTNFLVLVSLGAVAALVFKRG